jgi:hypothetical protein
MRQKIPDGSVEASNPLFDCHTGPECIKEDSTEFFALERRES